MVRVTRVEAEERGRCHVMGQLIVTIRSGEPSKYFKQSQGEQLRDYYNNTSERLSFKLIKWQRGQGKEKLDRTLLMLEST